MKLERRLESGLPQQCALNEILFRAATNTFEVSRACYYLALNSVKLSMRHLSYPKQLLAQEETFSFTLVSRKHRINRFSYSVGDTSDAFYRSRALLANLRRCMSRRLLRPTNPRTPHRAVPQWSPLHGSAVLVVSSLRHFELVTPSNDHGV